MRIGQQLGPFIVDKELGAGAMGAVYRARSSDTGQKVAIKIIAPGLMANKTLLERFKRESSILKQLRHPNIVRLVATGRYQSTPFYAMEYIEGESLDHVMARRGRITWEEVVTLGQQLCAALQHAHDKGIVHRDLKPSNLMVLPDGTLKLTDFGIAKDLDVTALTSAHCTVGTAAYMSPEQCRGERELTSKSDLYSMGVMFYELLTGRKPFVAESPMEMFMKHVNGTCERPSRLVFDIPVWLDTLVTQLMEKLPEQRPHNAAAVAEALNRVKERVEAQQSAGVEVARGRAIDRPHLDEEDKEAARSLLGKKKRKKHIPFYRRGWFQKVGIASILLVMGWVFYTAFLKVPSLESLYQDAAPLMNSSDEKKWEEARKEPLAMFLKYYADSKEPQADKLRAWADEYDFRTTVEAINTRLTTNFNPNDEAKPATLAVTQEKEGRLEEARGQWQSLLKYRTDPDLRGWVLVADKYLKDLDLVDPKEKEYRKKVAAEPPQNPYKGESKAEDLVLQALRAEAADNFDDAKKHWQTLKASLAPDQPRTWHHLLAFKRLREIDEKK